MKKVLLTLGAAVIAAAGMASTAEAGGYGRGYYGGYGHGYHGGWHHHDNGAAIGAGILGLGVGALIGSAVTSNSYRQPGYYYEQAPVYVEPAPVYVAPRPVYVAPRPVYRAAPAPVYYGAANSHVAACSARYRSYDPRSDTFLGYDGYRHACTLY